MGLKHILLGLLANKPGSGYTLHRRFFVVLRPALSQIYRTLAEMTDEGLVTFEKIDQEKLPAQKVYFITETGIAVLDHWLRSSLEPKVGRDMFAAQIWFGSRIGKEDMIKKIKAQAEKTKRHLRRAKTETRRKIEKGAQSSGNELDEFFWNMSTDCLLVQAEAWLKWADDAIQKLSSLESKDARARTLLRKTEKNKEVM